MLDQGQFDFSDIGKSAKPTKGEKKMALKNVLDMHDQRQSDFQKGEKKMAYGLALLIEEAKKHGWVETDEESIQRDLIVPEGFVKVDHPGFAVIIDGERLVKWCHVRKLSFRCDLPMSDDPEIHADILKRASSEMKSMGITHVRKLIERVPIIYGIKAPWSEIIVQGCMIREPIKGA